MIVAPETRDYLASLTPEDPSLARAAAEGRAERGPVADRTVGRFLEALVLASGARRVLEVGAAGGYRTLWLARSLPEDGGLLSIEIDPRRAATARARLEDAGLGDRAHVIVGDAARMVHKVAGPFDVIVNAGDERQYGPLLDRLAALLRPGGVLMTGKVLRAAQASRMASRASAQSPVLMTGKVLRAGEAAPVSARSRNLRAVGEEPAEAGKAADQEKAVNEGELVAAYNRRIAADPRFVTSFVPVGEGIAVSVKSRPGAVG